MDSLGKLMGIKVLEFAAQRKKPCNEHHVQDSLSRSELSTHQVFCGCVLKPFWPLGHVLQPCVHVCVCLSVCKCLPASLRACLSVCLCVVVFAALKEPRGVNLVSCEFTLVSSI